MRGNPSTNAAVARKMFAFGQQIRSFRKGKGLDQGEFGNMIGLGPKSRGSLSSIENGTRNLGFPKMVAIARALGFDLKLSYVPLSEMEIRASAKNKQPDKKAENGATASEEQTPSND